MSTFKPIDDALISQLLLTENKPKSQGGAGKRGPKIDPTTIREINVWYKLQHHMCLQDCEHRQAEGNASHNACWNPECKDTRPHSDKGTNVVVAVKGKYMCRYCYLDGWLHAT